MGKDEMLSISTDKWDSEIWGAAHPSATGTPRPKLFFYFGERDHWVADRTRADLMLARGRRGMHGGTDEEWKPRMEVDDMGVPHGFCICEFYCLLFSTRWGELWLTPGNSA